MNVSGPEMQNSADGRELKFVEARLGGPVRINLWEDRTRGELWVPSYDPKGLVLTEDDFLRTASGNAVESGKRTFVFCAIAPGTHDVVFEKRMGWKFTAEDRRVFRIAVTGETRSGAEEPCRTLVL